MAIAALIDDHVLFLNSSTTKDCHPIILSNTEQNPASALSLDQEEFDQSCFLQNIDSYENTNSSVSKIDISKNSGKNKKDIREKPRLFQQSLDESSVSDFIGSNRKERSELVKQTTTRSKNMKSTVPEIHSFSDNFFQKMLEGLSQKIGFKDMYSRYNVQMLPFKTEAQYVVDSLPSNATHADTFQQKPFKHYKRLVSTQIYHNSNYASRLKSRQARRASRTNVKSTLKSSFSNACNTCNSSEWVDVDNSFHKNDRNLENFSDAEKIKRAWFKEHKLSRYNSRTFHNDPSVPYTLSLYLQLFLNFFLSCIFIYFFYILVSTIRNDVDKKVQEYSTEILAEMAECSKQYLRNNCIPGRRVPALEKMCVSLERCMNRDPTIVGHARVSAETFSEIINSFIKPLTLKTWLVIGGFMISSFVFSNTAFTVFRSSQSFNNSNTNNQNRHQSHQQQSDSGPVSTSIDYNTVTGPFHEYSRPIISKPRGLNKKNRQTRLLKKQVKSSPKSKLQYRAGFSTTSSATDKRQGNASH